jgi:hypothetical protein
MRLVRIIIVLLAVMSAGLCARAETGDTTIVPTFNQELVNSTAIRVATFQFPAAGVKYSQVTLHMVIGCPGYPGDCDPWDRFGHLSIRVPTGDTTFDRIEIARFITPYDITGGGGPGTCPWDYDLTAYQPLLHDSVTLALYITTSIGGNNGWLITATFELIEGQPDPEPYRVQLLWDIGYLVYGDPDNPPESHIEPAQVFTDETTQSVLARVYCTGHGQGNTDNAAEFSNKWHRLWIIGDMYQHQLWRNDCGSNPCRPQGGTWQYNRAGWCPGASVPPWDITYTNFAPGDIVEFYYEIQPFTNYCRPTNPDCISGVTCTDCAYNSTGHTQPHYRLAANAVLYRAPLSSAHAAPLPSEIALHQNVPNPFNAQTTIRFDLAHRAHACLVVHDLMGREVAELVDDVLSSGPHEISFDARALPSGVYFYSLIVGPQHLTRKLLLVK